MMNGDKYWGSWKNNLKHGDGTYSYHKSGRLYEGEWAYDKRDGYGSYSVRVTDDTIVQTEKMVSVEAFENDFCIQKTTDVRASSASALRRVYTGEWKEDQKCGRGIYFYKDESVYDGEWLNDKREGLGKLTFIDKSSYQGEWHLDKRHGHGILVLANGDRYEGMWLNDLKEGPGKFVFESKRQYYEGEWSSNLPRFGTLSDFPVVCGIESRKWPIPQLQLVDPNAVLQEQKDLLVQERCLRFPQNV